MIKDFLIIGAFRYSLGRQTYVVQETVEWLMAYWSEVSPKAQAVIRRDLEKAVKDDDMGRSLPIPYKPLGADCDRAEWVKLWEKIK